MEKHFNSILARSTTKEIRCFLTNLANLGEDKASVELFRSRHGQHFCSVPNLAETPREQAAVAIEKHFADRVLILRNTLFSIVDSPQERERDWHLHVFRSMVIELSQPAFPKLSWDVYLKSTQSGLRLPPRSFLEKVASYLPRILSHFRRCPNCERFYIARHGNRKYCSRKCAQPFRLKANQRWWDEHGKEWRQARRRAKRKMKQRGGRQR
jgi:hypothetical protein